MRDMNNLNNNINQIEWDGNSVQSRIILLLSKHPEGLTIIEISSLLGIHRHTAIKYIMELKGARLIVQRPVGSAILHYINPKINPNSLGGSSKSLEEKRRIYA